MYGAQIFAVVFLSAVFAAGVLNVRRIDGKWPFRRR
jgi:hypothetical protein